MDMIYRDEDTFFHRLDPRAKLFMMLFTFVFAVMTDSWTVYIVLAALTILDSIISKSYPNLKKISFVLFMLMMMSLVFWAIGHRGPTKLIGFITLEGLIFGANKGVKIIIMIIAGMNFLSTTKIEEISAGLVKIGLPYRGAFAFSTAIRLIPMVLGTTETIIQAQKSRGLDLDSGSIIAKVKKYMPLMIPAFVSVIRNTNVFSMALESKGFGYADKKTSYIEVKMKTIDWVIIVLLIVTLLLLIFLKIKRYI